MPLYRLVDAGPHSLIIGVCGGANSTSKYPVSSRALVVRHGAVEPVLGLDGRLSHKSPVSYCARTGYRYVALMSRRDRIEGLRDPVVLLQVITSSVLRVRRPISPLLGCEALELAWCVMDHCMY